jgi:FPC/CPF motif-containing protein YcgG
VIDVRGKFGELVARIACPYALGASYVLAPEWKDGEVFAVAMERLAKSFDAFLTEASSRRSDLLVFAITKAEYITVLSAFASIFCRTLDALASRDPTRTVSLRSGILSRDWDFTYRGEPFFVPTFAPFYPENHPRHSWSRDIAFIVFQGDYAFDRRGVQGDRPFRRRISESVERAFRKAGCPYELTRVVDWVKSERYVHPLADIDSPVHWWMH